MKLFHPLITFERFLQAIWRVGIGHFLYRLHGSSMQSEKEENVKGAAEDWDKEDQQGLQVVCLESPGPADDTLEKDLDFVRNVTSSRFGRISLLPPRCCAP